MKKYFWIYIISAILIGIIGGYILKSTSSDRKSQALSGDDIKQNISDNISSRKGNGKGNGQGGYNKQNCISDDCLSVTGIEYPAGKISEEVKTALGMALDDEYKAYALYEKVIEKLGMVRPFSMIIRAEENHISSLKALFDKYGLSIPENSWTSRVTSPASRSEACMIGVDAEIENGKLYREKLLPLVKDYEDITRVFINLMDASEQKHLPAFQKCI